MWTQNHIYYGLKFSWSQCLKLLALLLFMVFFCWSSSLKLFTFFFFMVVLLVLVFKVMGPPIYGHLVGPSVLKVLMTSSSLWCSEVVGPPPLCGHFIGLGVLKLLITSSSLWCSKVVGPPPFVGPVFETSLLFDPSPLSLSHLSYSIQ